MVLIGEEKLKIISPKDVVTYFVILGLILILMFLYDKIKNYAKELMFSKPKSNSENKV